MPSIAPAVIEPIIAVTMNALLFTFSIFSCCNSEIVFTITLFLSCSAVTNEFGTWYSVCKEITVYPKFSINIGTL